MHAIVEAELSLPTWVVEEGGGGGSTSRGVSYRGAIAQGGQGCDVGKRLRRGEPSSELCPRQNEHMIVHS